MNIQAVSGFQVALIAEARAPELISALNAAGRYRADTSMRGDRDVPFGYRVENGAAIIPIRGALLTDGPFIGPRFDVTSYEGLRAELRRAAADPKVSRIVLAINSPGGMVAGLDSVSQAIADAKRQKPVVALVEGLAASAAYWIASQASEIVMTPLSEVGSIGVVGMHIDVSGAMAQQGFNVTLIYSGRDKVAGNPFEPLSADARKSWQADVDWLRGQFAAAVSTGRRGKFSAAQAMATEAQIYNVQKAVALGMADRVGFLDSVIGRAGGQAFPGSAGAQASRQLDYAAIYARSSGKAAAEAPPARGSGIDPQAIYANRRNQSRK